MSYPLGKYGFGPFISTRPQHARAWRVPEVRRQVVAMALLEGRVERWHCRW